MKSLYRIGGQDYCRHHIIRAAVAAGVVTEVKPGAGPVAAMPRGASRPSTTSPTGTDPVYAVTLHQPWATLIALGVKTAETRSWPSPAHLIGQTIAIHGGKRVVRQPGGPIERELRTRLGENWQRAMPAGTVLATATLAGMARVAHIDQLTEYAAHHDRTETGCAVGLGRTRVDPWEDFSSGRWLWLLAEVKPLPEPLPAVGHQSFWNWNGDGG